MQKAAACDKVLFVDGRVSYVAMCGCCVERYCLLFRDKRVNNSPHLAQASKHGSSCPALLTKSCIVLCEALKVKPTCSCYSTEILVWEGSSHSGVNFFLHYATNVTKVSFALSRLLQIPSHEKISCIVSPNLHLFSRTHCLSIDHSLIGSHSFEA